MGEFWPLPRLRFDGGRGVYENLLHDMLLDIGVDPTTVRAYAARAGVPFESVARPIVDLSLRQSIEGGELRELARAGLRTSSEVIVDGMDIGNCPPMRVVNFALAQMSAIVGRQ